MKQRDDEMATTTSDVKTSDEEKIDDMKEECESNHFSDGEEDEEAKPKRKMSREERRGGKRRMEKAKEAECAPKAGMSAYFLFLDANRGQIKKDNPEISYADFGRMVDVMWAKADQSEWEEKALLDQQRFENEMKEYNKAKGKKETQRPRLNCNSFSFFLTDKREEIKELNPGLDDSGILNKAREEFKKVENKAEWQKKALLDKQRYDNEMKVYNKARAHEHSVSKAYYMFLNAKREEIKTQYPDLDPFEIKRKATEMFNELEDKSEWEEKAMLDQKEKDKDAPAYYAFLNAKRDEIKAQNPGINSLQIKRKAGEMFRELEDISEWEEKARQKEEKVKEREIRYGPRNQAKRRKRENRKARKMMFQLQSTEKES